MEIIPLVLSGGAGTRLWPLSRQSRPKQFLKLGDETSLFQNTLLRCSGPAFDSKPIVVAADEHRFLVAEGVRELNLEADILLEPVSRNSCAAIVAGCLQALERDVDAVVLVLAADHMIKDREGFVKTVLKAQKAAKSGRLVTFGIEPDFPATGYGYIKPEGDANSDAGADVNQFVEKPDADTAERYMEQGYLWNSGNFLFSAKAFLEEAERLNSELVMTIREAFEKRSSDLDFLRLEETAFSKASSISVDYAVMERTEKASVFAASHDWSDIGTWHSVWRNLSADEAGNVVLGDAVLNEAKGNLVHSQERLTTLAGVDDLIVVVTRDAVLVTSHEKSEMIGGLVAQLKEAGREEATKARKVYRPWGNYETLDVSQQYQVKRIVIMPEGELSLQKHKKRAEHWVIVEGSPDVTIGETVTRLKPNQSVYIPMGETHRISNSGEKPVVLIEVQTGTYFGEDDIIRLEDRYNRT